MSHHCDDRDIVKAEWGKKKKNQTSSTPREEMRNLDLL